MSDGWVEITTIEKPEDSLIRSLRLWLAERERELLALKGPCSFKDCRLHYAHSGPCDVAVTA